jgi:MFS family permease
MTAPDAKSQPSLGELIGVATFLIGLVSAWLYVAGWTYAYHYFDRFGIPLLMVDIPKEMYFVYGGTVVRQFSIIALAVGAVGLVLLILWRRFGDAKWRWSATATTGVVTVLVLAALFWIGRYAAVAVAHRQYVLQRESDYSGYPRVQVWLKQDSKPQNGSPNPSGDLTSGCYRLLLYNQNRLFLLRSFKGAPAADLPILILPWDQIELTRVLPDYSSCG